MGSNLPPRQTFSTTRGYSYSYIHAGSRDGKPTLLFIHGWPSHIDDWVNQINHFQSNGYGVLAPDMLGYGGSSNPPDVNAYRLKLICQDLAELQDQVKVAKTIGVGHDWGATILSRLAMYYPHSLSAVAFLGIGVPSPGVRFDLDAINEMTKKASGMEMLGYINYICRDPISQQTMERNAESVMDIMFAADPRTWYKFFHPLGGMKDFVEGQHRQEVGEWFYRELQQKHLEVFKRLDGYLGPSRYYQMLDQNLSLPDEEELKDFKITIPALVVIPSTPAHSAQMQVQITSSWVPRLLVRTIDSGHWVHLEKSNETNEALEELLQSPDLM
ncbi:uncharacterized protein JN550_010198 [Neoarthrinium moseri]|uniref:uncharacterized protein n=1 Tax=Neoarthrinium moseri TaxID=1658444 RepID=UPI001FDB725A|nr:uncharacterized protein JN550_010198 [Neoarthrinium moseri]KAI1862336.1 hypothetical protein JN550_010198 [Neoarthrinium moseri]